MSSFEEMYWEQYDDQNAPEFQYVGVAGEEPQPIDCIEKQVAEFRRLHGHNVEILVYQAQPETVVQ